VLAGCDNIRPEDVESLLLDVRTAERCFVTVIHDRKFASIDCKSG